jgi:DNA-binding GntR family transcriptional regulator
VICHNCAEEHSVSAEYARYADVSRECRYYLSETILSNIIYDVLVTTATSKPTLVDEVHDAIYQALIDGQIEPGSKLKLNEMAGRYRVSAAVVREALSRLTEQGLVQSNPQRGFIVTPLSVDDLLDLTRTRVLIETLALRESIRHGDLTWEGRVLATHHTLDRTPMLNGERANPAWVQAHRAFHHAILDGSGVRRLSDVARGLRDCSELYQFWSYSRSREPNRDIAAEHREITERTLAGDEDNAAAALTEHIGRTTTLLVAYLSRSRQ